MWLKPDFYNRKKKRTIRRMDDCNWNGELTQYPWKQRWLQVLISKKHSTLENIRSLQVASWNNKGTTQVHGCKCSFEISSKTLCIHNSWLQVLFENKYNIHNHFREITKHCTLEKTFPCDYSKLQRKNAF